MIRKKRFVIAALLVVVAAGALFFWARSGGEKGEGLRTEPVDRGDVQATVTATGTISAVTTVQVGSQVSGIVSKLYADWNSPVKKGQLLAELDPTPFQQQVDQRRADRLKAEVDKSSTEIAFHRQERLLAEQLAAQSDYDSAKAAFDGSKAGVAQATAALKQAETN
ncbi:MAG TPA: biotin/lipoyl-binding protein, partial [Candidatus Polarisedimenticolia bacterium]|nr:biotin/lipoyl-binding protein [Candidatus Polarisedimenticolia bacterium]